MTLAVAAAVSAGGSRAQAEEAATRKSVAPFTAGVELGGFFPQLVSKLETNFSAAVELGYLLSPLEKRLGVYLSVAYTQPTHAGEATDPRLPGGGVYSYEIVEQELLVNLGAIYRIHPPRTRLNYYGQAGLRVDLQRSKVSGAAGGAAFGENQETATKLGAHAAAGVEYLLGPGALAGEVDFGVAKLSQFTTGDATAGGLSLLVGYHLFF